MRFFSKTFVLYLGGPEELDKKSSVFEELRPSAIQKHLIFRPTLQDPQDIEQKSQRLPTSQILGPVPLVPSGSGTSGSGTSATGPKWFWDQCHWSQVALNGSGTSGTGPKIIHFTYKRSIATTHGPPHLTFI